MNALSVATKGPAKYFGLGDRRKVEVEGRADLVLVKGDPMANIGATGRLEGSVVMEWSTSQSLQHKLKRS